MNEEKTNITAQPNDAMTLAREAKNSVQVLVDHFCLNFSRAQIIHEVMTKFTPEEKLVIALGIFQERKLEDGDGIYYHFNMPKTEKVVNAMRRDYYEKFCHYCCVSFSLMDESNAIENLYSDYTINAKTIVRYHCNDTIEDCANEEE